MKSLMELGEGDLWLEDGTIRLCDPLVNWVWKWCDEALMLKYASFAMIFFGLATSGLLAAAAFFMYYYAHEHATRTGRKWCLGCLIGAPVCGFIGVLQYLLLTLNFSDALNTFGVLAHTMYGPGFFICCMLTLASCLPLYIHYGFGKKSLQEKGDLTYEQDPSLNSGYDNYGGYGAAGGSGAYTSGNNWNNQAHSPPPAGPVQYGAPASNVYVTQVQVPLAPQPQQYPGPGSGLAAW